MLPNRFFLCYKIFYSKIIISRTKGMHFRLYFIILRIILKILRVSTERVGSIGRSRKYLLF